MKKVLIADDEFLVRLGLKTTIKWEENGFLVVGEANNGKEALELFEKYEPDILLTDIRMPIMSGLELIQTLKQRKKSFKAVILTHYDDFSYAQEAIKLGASEYILKSDLTAEQLLSVLKKISLEIQDLNENANRASIDESTKVFDKDVFREEFLEKIVTGKIKAQSTISKILSLRADIFLYDSFVFVTGVIENINNTSYEKGEDLFIKTVKNVSKMVFDGMDIIKISMINKQGITYLLNLRAEKKSNLILEDLINYMGLLKKNLKQFLDIDLTIGISELGYSIDNLLELFEQSVIAQKDCFFNPLKVAVFNKRMNEQKGECPKINLEVLKAYVKELEVQNIKNYINDIFGILNESKQINHVRDIFSDFLSFAKMIAKELNLQHGPAISELKFSYSNFDKLQSIDAVQQYIFNLYCSLVEYTGANKPNVYSYIIGKSIAFIKMNYQKNITLVDAADHVEISKSYLSLLFKQETGINFSVYLTNYRVEKAKKLLLDSNMKIYEIAEKVGFDNPYYFSKVFKDTTGMTSKEFKKNNI